MGIIGVALGVALLPTVSHYISSNDAAGAARAQSSAIIAGMALTIPAAAGLAVLAHPLVQLFFERGAFTSEDSIATAMAVQVFCFGLPAFILIRLLQPAFFARKDTLTPLIDAAVGVILNITLSLVLFPKYGHLAIAFATTCAGYLTVVLTLIRIWLRAYWRPDYSFVRRIITQKVSAIIMAAGVYLFISYVEPITKLGLLAMILGAVILGAIIFGGLLWLLGGATRDDFARLRRPQ